MWPEVEMQELRATGQGGQALMKGDLSEAHLPLQTEGPVVRTGFQVAHAGPPSSCLLLPKCWDHTCAPLCLAPHQSFRQGVWVCHYENPEETPTVLAAPDQGPRKKAWRGPRSAGGFLILR